MIARNRQKAPDVFRGAEFLFSEKTSSFEKAFPQILELTVKIEERNGNGHPCRAYGINRTNVSEYIDCSNPLCYNGGISVGQILRNMAWTKAIRHEEEYRRCQGYEGSPKGRRRYGPCSQSFRIVAEVTYHS